MGGAASIASNENTDSKYFLPEMEMVTKPGGRKNVILKKRQLTSLVKDAKLKTILDSNDLCRAFRQYIEYEFHLHRNNKLRPAANYAHSALLFFIRVNDLLSIPRGTARSLYSLQIHEQFIALDAPTLAPLTIYSLQQLRLKFTNISAADNSGNIGIGTDDVRHALEDTFDFLLHGAFRRFVRDNGPYGYLMCLQSRLLNSVTASSTTAIPRTICYSSSAPTNIFGTEIKNLRTKRGVRANKQLALFTATASLPDSSTTTTTKSSEKKLGRSPSVHLPISILEIMESTLMLKYFNAYMMKKQPAHLGCIAFYRAATAFELTFEIMQTFGSTFVQDSQGELYCMKGDSSYKLLLSIALKIYSTYVRFEGRHDISLDTKLVTEIQKAMGKSKLYCNIFRNALYATRNFLEIHILPAFKQSEDFFAMNNKANHSSNSTSGTNGGRKNAPISMGEIKANHNQTNDIAKTFENHQSVPYLNPVPLSVVLTSPSIRFYHQYLDSVGYMNAFYLLTDIQNFRNIPATKQSYMRSTATRIFDRFLSQNARRQVQIPRDIVRLAKQDLDNEDDIQLDMFDDVEGYVCKVLAAEYPAYVESNSYVSLLFSHYEHIEASKLRLSSVSDNNNNMLGDLIVADGRSEKSDFIEMMRFKNLRRYFRRFMLHSSRSALAFDVWSAYNDLLTTKGISYADARKEAYLLYKKFFKSNNNQCCEGKEDDKDILAFIPYSLQLSLLAIYKDDESTEQQATGVYKQVVEESRKYLEENVYPEFVSSIDYEAMTVARHAISRSTGAGSSTDVQAQQQLMASERRVKRPEREYANISKLLGHPVGLVSFGNYADTLAEENRDIKKHYNLWIECEDIQLIPANTPYKTRREKRILQTYGDIIPEDCTDLTVSVREVQIMAENVLQKIFATFLKSEMFSKFLRDIDPAAKASSSLVGMISALGASKKLLKRRKRQKNKAVL